MARTMEKRVRASMMRLEYDLLLGWIVGVGVVSGGINMTMRWGAYCGALNICFLVDDE